MPVIGLFIENPCHTFAAEQSVTKFMSLIYETLVTVKVAAKLKFIHKEPSYPCLWLVCWIPTSHLCTRTKCDQIRHWVKKIWSQLKLQLSSSLFIESAYACLRPNLLNAHITLMQHNKVWPNLCHWVMKVWSQLKLQLSSSLFIELAYACLRPNL